MQQRTSILLAAVAVVAIGAAWQFGIRATPPADQAVSAGTLVFPGLAARLGEVARIEIQSKDKTLALIQANGKWGLADRGGFPVQQDKLREMLTGLTELRLTEARTADPAQYDRLGVEEPGSSTGTATLLRLLDGGGKPIVSLIVGHRRVRTQGDVPESIFVRRPGEAQSWLAEGRLPVDADAQLWFEREIANVPLARIAKVVSTRGDVVLEFARDGDKMTMSAPAEHPKLDDYRVDDVGRALESLTLTDVRPAAEEPGEKVGTAVFTTTDGVAITATVFKTDKDIWAQFAASGTGAGQKDAEALQAHVQGWAYQLGAWKEKSLVPTLDDLKASEPEKPADAAAPASE